MNIKYLSFIVLFLLTACISSEERMGRQTVKITNLGENSGGSGSIIRSSHSKSLVLTNAHVCQVAVKGGLVHDSEGNKFLVKSFKTSKLHDLCLITVIADLKYSAKLASAPPVMFETADVAGHPRLLPTIISYGHFAEKKVIQVTVGVRACTDAERQDPNVGFFCAILGQLPIIRSYESMVVSALIQPGSSGSAIYNSNGEIAGVVFAGSSELSYGFAVPFEYIYEFLNNESKILEDEIPNLDLDLAKMLAGSSSDSVHTYIGKVREVCEKNKDNPTVNKVCKTWFSR